MADDPNQVLSAESLNARLAALRQQEKDYGGWPIDASHEAASAMKHYTSARFAAAEAQTPEDMLATVRGFYPDAIVRRTGGESTENGLPTYTQPTSQILLPDQTHHVLVPFLPPGLQMEDLFKPGVQVARGLAYGAAAAAAPEGAPMALPVVLGTAGSQAVDMLAQVIGKHIGQNGGGTVDTRSLRDKILDRVGSVVSDLVGGAGVEMGGRALQASQAAGARRMLAGPDAPSMARPGVTQALTEEGVPLEGAAPLVNSAPAVRSGVERLSRDPRSANEMVGAMRQVDEALDQSWQSALEKTGSQVATREAAGASVQSGVQGAGAVERATQQGLENTWAARIDQAAHGARPSASTGPSGQLALKVITGPDGKPWANADHLAQELDAIKAESTGPSGNATKSLFPADLQGLRGEIETGKGFLPLAYFRKMRTWMGDEGGSTTLLPGNRPDLQRAYGAATQDFADASQAAGKDTAQAWDALNEHWQEWAGRRDLLQSIANAPTATVAFARTGWDPAKIGALRKTLAPDQFNDLVHLKLMELGRTDVNGQPGWSPELFLKSWNNPKLLPPKTKDILFGEAGMGPGTVQMVSGQAGRMVQPQPLSELRTQLDRLATIADAQKDSAWGQVTRNVASRDMVAQSMAGLQEQGRGFIAGLKDPMSIPGRLWGVAWKAGERELGTTPAAQARLMTDPKFVRWLADGYRYNPADARGLALHLSRLTGIGISQHLEPEVQSFVRGMAAQLPAPAAEGPATPTPRAVPQPQAAPRLSVRQQLEQEDQEWKARRVAGKR